MILSLNEVVLIHFQQGVVDRVTEIALTAIGKGDQIGKSLDIFLVVGTANERNESTKKVGNGNNLIAFIRTDDAGFTAGVHRGGDAREIFVAR